MSKSRILSGVLAGCVLCGGVVFYESYQSPAVTSRFNRSWNEFYQRDSAFGSSECLLEPVPYGSSGLPEQGGRWFEEVVGRQEGRVLGAAMAHAHVRLLCSPPGSLDAERQSLPIAHLKANQPEMTFWLPSSGGPKG